jgi:chromosome segregation ATPase
MNNEKYFNYYVETLTNTLTDAIVRNVSLQASVKIAEESIKEYEDTINLLDVQIGKLNEMIDSERNARNQSENSTIKDLEKQVSDLSSELNLIKSLKTEYESVKHQVQHVDTFRNELQKARKENVDLKSDYELKIKHLNEKIDYLQLTPAKRKKVDELNSQKETSMAQEINTTNPIRDGGSF